MSKFGILKEAEGQCFLRYFLTVLSHGNENAPATDLHYSMYREGRVTWKQIIQKYQDNEKQTLN
jgi:hypothetical protein